MDRVKGIGIIKFSFCKPVLNLFVNGRTVCKRNYLIEGLELGEINPFPVWIIYFSVYKTGFEVLGKS